MKILFDYEGHKIIVSRGVVTSELAVDGEVLDTCNGFTKNQVKAFDLCSTIHVNGKKADVKVHVDVKLFHDEVSLLVDEKLIETQKVSAF